MSAKEKGKVEEMARTDKDCYEREGNKKKVVQGFPYTQEASFTFFLSCSKYYPKIKQHPSLPIGDVVKKLGEMWNNAIADNKQKCKKHTADYPANGKPEAEIESSQLLFNSA
jgi:hypothetical protein